MSLAIKLLASCNHVVSEPSLYNNLPGVESRNKEE